MKNKLDPYRYAYVIMCTLGGLALFYLLFNTALVFIVALLATSIIRGILTISGLTILGYYLYQYFYKKELNEQERVNKENKK